MDEDLIVFHFLVEGFDEECHDVLVACFGTRIGKVYPDQFYLVFDGYT